MIGYLKNINDIFKQNLSETINDTLYESTKEEAIDYYNKFVGKVINNKDNEQLGRCQIRVFGLFGDTNDIPDEDLPWFIPDATFVGSLKGNFIVPPINTLVSVYFHKGDIYQGHYSTKIIDTKNLPKRRLKNYPDNMVFFETDQDDYLEMDRNSGAVVFHHHSGTQITIYDNGNVIMNCSGKVFTARGANNCEIYGNESTNLGGNFKVLYSLTGTIPTDASGNPIQGVGVSDSVTVGI